MMRPFGNMYEAFSRVVFEGKAEPLESKQNQKAFLKKPLRTRAGPHKP